MQTAWGSAVRLGTAIVLPWARGCEVVEGAAGGGFGVLGRSAVGCGVPEGVGLLFIRYQLGIGRLGEGMEQHTSWGARVGRESMVIS